VITSAYNMAQTVCWAMRRCGTGLGGHVAYIGGHGGGNLGDDLMVDIAQRLFSDRRLVDCAESWHEKRLARVGLSGSRYFRHVLLGGGTLISPFWFGKVQAAVHQGLPVSTLGTGVGSCGFIQRDDVDLSGWAPLLERFVHLGVRGPRSQARLERLGIEHAQVVGDLALYLTRDEPIEADERPSVAINLSLPAEDEPQYGEAQRYEELVHTLRPYLMQGWTLRPYAMNPKDVQPTQHLVDRLVEAKTPVRYLRSVSEFFDYVGPATANVAVRLHGVILGCCAGVPPIILGYRDKCLDFADSLGLAKQSLYLPEAQMGDIAITTASALEAAPKMRPLVLSRALELKGRLVAHVQRLREELG
jgi:polysaccharide pyruvyl transferase WcaK-like protein